MLKSPPTELPSYVGYPREILETEKNSLLMDSIFWMTMTLRHLFMSQITKNETQGESVAGATQALSCCYAVLKDFIEPI